jgi:hypothetical protein
MSASIPCPNYAAWYRMAGEFFKNAEGATLEQLDAGHKAIALAWIGVQEEPKPHETFQAVILLEMIGRRVMQAELREAMTC